MSVLATSPDGAFIAGATSSGAIYVWETSSGRLLRTWGAHYKAVTCILFVGGASLLMSGGDDTMVHVWFLPELLDTAVDPASTLRPTPLHSWADHTLPVTSLLAGVGEVTAIVASASLDRTIKIRRLADGALLRVVALPTAVNAMVLEPGEQLLFAAGADGTIYQIALCGDAATTAGGGASATGPSAAGTLSNAGGAAGGGAVAAGTSGQLSDHAVFVGHSRGVTCLALTAPRFSGRVQHSEQLLLVSGSEDASVRLWDLHSRMPVQVLTAPGKEPVRGIVVLPRQVWPDAADTAAAAAVAGGKVEPAGLRGARRAAVLRPLPLAPLSKFVGTAANLQRWEGAPVLISSTATTAVASGAGARGGLCRWQSCTAAGQPSVGAGGVASNGAAASSGAACVRGLPTGLEQGDWLACLGALVPADRAWEVAS